MKNRLWIFAFSLAIIVLAIVLWRHPRKEVTNSPEAAQVPTPTNVTPTVTAAATVSQSVTNQPLSNIPSQTNSSTVKTDREKLPELFQKYNEGHNTPIEFYGQVIDQNSNPVPDVKIDVAISQTSMASPTNLAFIPKTSHLEKLTGADGRLEIRGETGDGMDIESIQKSGYEPSSKTPRAIPLVRGTVENPVLFKMWRMGEKAQLVSSSKFWGIIPDGRTYTIDLLQGTKVESATADGDLRISVTRPAGVSRQDHYDWSFQITPIDGGIVQTEDEFMYEAPENGYAPSYDFRLSTADTNWTARVKKDFYIETRNGKNYGRIDLEVFAHYQGQGVLNIGWSINPNSSRNLQP